VRSGSELLWEEAGEVKWREEQSDRLRKTKRERRNNG
jgi:hypothetical protein